MPERFGPIETGCRRRPRLRDISNDDNIAFVEDFVANGRD